MEMFLSVLRQIGVILFSAILVENFVLTKFMGVCPFLGVSKKMDSALGMSGAVIAIMLAATAITYPVFTYLLNPFNLSYLRVVAFILIIALFVQLIELTLKKFLPPLYNSLGVYLPLITTNCAVLGVTILNIDNEYVFWESMVNALGAGLGFMLALVVFAGIRERIEHCDVPKAFKGVPVTLIAASIVSIVFTGFSGMIDGIFNV